MPLYYLIKDNASLTQGNMQEEYSERIKINELQKFQNINLEVWRILQAEVYIFFKKEFSNLNTKINEIF